MLAEMLLETSTLAKTLFCRVDPIRIWVGLNLKINWVIGRA
jgi:hypothetical protein